MSKKGSFDCKRKSKNQSLVFVKFRSNVLVYKCKRLNIGFYTYKGENEYDHWGTERNQK